MIRKLIAGILVCAFFIPHIPLAAETDAERRERLEAELQNVERQILTQQRLVEDKQLERQTLERDIAIIEGEIRQAQLGIQARLRLTESLANMRIKTGDEGTVSVERDGQNPPAYMEITVTEAGKALGPEEVSKKLCAALKEGSDKSRTGRAEAQKDMMQCVGEEMKKLG